MVEEHCAGCGCTRDQVVDQKLNKIIELLEKLANSTPPPAIKLELDSDAKRTLFWTKTPKYEPGDSTLVPGPSAPTTPTIPAGSSLPTEPGLYSLADLRGRCIAEAVRWSYDGRQWKPITVRCCSERDHEGPHRDSHGFRWNNLINNTEYCPSCSQHDRSYNRLVIRETNCYGYAQCDIGHRFWRYAHSNTDGAWKTASGATFDGIMNGWAP